MGRRGLCHRNAHEQDGGGKRHQGASKKIHRVFKSGFFGIGVAGAGVTEKPGACRALVVEAKSRLCEDRFSTFRRHIVVLRAKKRRKYGPHIRICSPTDQSPTGS